MWGVFGRGGVSAATHLLEILVGHDLTKLRPTVLSLASSATRSGPLPYVIIKVRPHNFGDIRDCAHDKTWTNS